MFWLFRFVFCFKDSLILLKFAEDTKKPLFMWVVSADESWGRQPPGQRPVIPSPSIHAPVCVHPPFILTQGWPMWPTENGRSDGVWFQRLGRTRDYRSPRGLFCCSFWRKPITMCCAHWERPARRGTEHPTPSAWLVSKPPWKQILHPQSGLQVPTTSWETRKQNCPASHTWVPDPQQCEGLVRKVVF